MTDLERLREKQIQDLLDGIVWWPTDEEAKWIYGTDEGVSFCQKIREFRLKTLRELISAR